MRISAALLRASYVRGLVAAKRRHSCWSREQGSINPSNWDLQKWLPLRLPTKERLEMAHGRVSRVVTYPAWFPPACLQAPRIDPDRQPYWRHLRLPRSWISKAETKLAWRRYCHICSPSTKPIESVVASGGHSSLSLVPKKKADYLCSKTSQCCESGFSPGADWREAREKKLPTSL